MTGELTREVLATHWASREPVDVPVLGKTLRIDGVYVTDCDRFMVVHGRAVVDGQLGGYHGFTYDQQESRYTSIH